MKLGAKEVNELNKIFTDSARWSVQNAKYRPVNWERVAVAMEPFQPTPHPAETAEMLDRESRDRAGMSRVPGGKKWDVAAQKYRPIDAARVAVVGEELGTQAKLLPIPQWFAAREQEPLPSHDINRDTVTIAALEYIQLRERHDRSAALEAELAQVKHQNEDLVQMCIARVGERDDARAQLAKLLADFTEHLRRGAQTVVAPVPAAAPTKPTIPMCALTFQRQAVGLLTEKP